MKTDEANPEPRQVADLLPTARVFLIGVAALAIFALGSLGAVALWKQGERAQQPSGPPPIPAQVGEAEIGEVFQLPFDAFGRGQLLRETQRRQLESYGWADRPRGVIHIPIDRAIDLYLAERRP